MNFNSRSTTVLGIVIHSKAARRRSIWWSRHFFFYINPIILIPNLEHSNHEIKIYSLFISYWNLIHSRERMSIELKRRRVTNFHWIWMEHTLGSSYIFFFLHSFEHTSHRYECVKQTNRSERIIFNFFFAPIFVTLISRLKASIRVCFFFLFLCHLNLRCSIWISLINSFWIQFVTTQSSRHHRAHIECPSVKYLHLKSQNGN